MKKYYLRKTLFLVLCIIFLGASFGCEKINVNSKKDLEISLYENGSTGYSWSYDINNKDIIDIKEEYDNSNCDKNADGCGGQRIYKIKGIKSGEVKISLKYCFVNSDEYPCKTAIYDIVVDKNLNISETHYGTYFDNN